MVLSPSDSTNKMKFGIVVAKDIQKAKDLSQKVEKFLRAGGHEISRTDLQGCQLVITLGGDGTLIHAACEYIELNVPFVGINVGTLGFLTAAEAGDWKEALTKITKGKYFVSERMTLEAEVIEKGKTEKGNFRAVNEMVVKGMYRVIDLDINVDDQKFLSISGDGVIVATQTGSTAYSLSSGGPIVDPEVDCFLMTPINAHGLPIPSVVISPEDVVAIGIAGGEDVSLIVDGQEHTKVLKGQTIRVLRGKYRVKFAYFDKHYFLKALNAKFGLASRLVG